MAVSEWKSGGTFAEERDPLGSPSQIPMPVETQDNNALRAPASRVLSTATISLKP
jgi:hypothetical protein